MKITKLSRISLEKLLKDKMNQPKSSHLSSKKRKGGESPRLRLLQKLPPLRLRSLSIPRKIQRPKSKSIQYMGLMK